MCANKVASAFLSSRARAGMSFCCLHLEPCPVYLSRLATFCFPSPSSQRHHGLCELPDTRIIAPGELLVSQDRNTAQVQIEKGLVKGASLPPLLQVLSSALLISPLEQAIY